MNNPRRVTLALFIALLISGACTLLLSRRIDHHAALQLHETVYYVAPSRPIQSGEVLRSADLRMLAWPASSPVAGASSHIEQAAGRAALYPLDPGQPLLERELTTPGSGTGLASKIPDGMRAIALRSDEVVGVAGFLTPGSHVDVLVTLHSTTSPDPTTATVLENVEILATGQQAEPDPAGKPETATVVTLLLTPEQAERALLASSQGTVHFGLRNNGDKRETSSAPVALSQLSGGRTPAPSAIDVPGAVARTAHAARPRSNPAPQSGTSTRSAEVITILGGEAQAGKSAERTQP